MIAVDSNLLIDAHREGSPLHIAAVETVDSLRHQPAPWAVPWPCLHEFIGIVTHPGIYKPASTLSEALGSVDALLASPQLHLLAESPGYFEKLREISLAAKLKGPRIHDARIAALLPPSRRERAVVGGSRLLGLSATQGAQPAREEVKAVELSRLLC